MRRSSIQPLFTLLLTGLLGASSAACSKTTTAQVVAPVEVSHAPATRVSQDEFPRALFQLLMGRDRSPKSKLLLAGVVQYQLGRAEELFERGFTREAEDMVTGALLLLRHDDELLSATRQRAAALMQAGHASARMGDAGRASALYDLSLAVTDDEALRAELSQHLKAIRDFDQSVTGKSALEQLGEQTRAALSRSVVDPRAENYLQAKSAILGWMNAALSSSAAEAQPTTPKERDLAMEAYRAIRSGAPAMVALNVRQGTPAAAASALREANLERALPPGYVALLEATAQEGAADAWLALFRQFEESRAEEPSEVSLPRYVNDAASFWAALGLYRSSEGRLEHAMPLAMILVEFGMPEVASIILSENSDQKTRPDALAWSLTLVLRGLLELSRTDQLDAARRSYKEAQPLIERANSLGKNGPDPARAQLVMAALEMRHAHVNEARALLLEAQKLAPRAETLLRLGRIEHHKGERQKALSHFEQAIKSAQQEGDLLLEAQGEQALFLLLRGSDEQKAQDALDRGLARTLVLQKMAPTTIPLAEIERHLADMLQYYDAKAALHQTYQRAIEQSRQNPVELEMTLTEMARVALTLGDARLGKLATTEATKLGLPAENAIYIALWYQILQRRSGQAEDGLSRQIFEQAGRARGWLNLLRKFGLGELSETELVKQARGQVEKTEAEFYSILHKQPRPSKLWPKELSVVAESPALDLVEVRMAADFLSHSATPKLRSVPHQLQLP